MPDPREARPEGDGCAAGQARLGGACWSAVGSRWSVVADAPGGTYAFELELLRANRVRVTDHEDASAASDEWYLSGGVLRIFLGDRFVEYRARVTNGTVLLGEAHSVRGQRWSWRARRRFADPTCPGAELLLDSACLTMAGTRWRLSGDGLDRRVVEFLADGRAGVASGDEPPTGSWRQEGGHLTFRLEAEPEGGGGRVFTAEVGDDRELAGQWVEGEARGAFGAVRLASIPPVMHR